MTGAIKGTFRDRLYQELGLDSLADRRYPRRLFFFHKVIQDRNSYHLIFILTIMLLVKERILLAQQHRMELSQFLQEPKYLRINFFRTALRNGVN